MDRDWNCLIGRPGRAWRRLLPPQPYPTLSQKLTRITNGISDRSLRASPDPKVLTNPFRKISACAAKKSSVQGEGFEGEDKGLIYYSTGTYLRGCYAQEISISTRAVSWSCPELK